MKANELTKRNFRLLLDENIRLHKENADIKKELELRMQAENRFKERLIQLLEKKIYEDESLNIMINYQLAINKILLEIKNLEV